MQTGDFLRCRFEGNITTYFFAEITSTAPNAFTCRFLQSGSEYVFETVNWTVSSPGKNFKAGTALAEHVIFTASGDQTFPPPGFITKTVSVTFDDNRRYLGILSQTGTGLERHVTFLHSGSQYIFGNDHVIIDSGGGFYKPGRRIAKMEIYVPEADGAFEDGSLAFANCLQSDVVNPKDPNDTEMRNFLFQLTTFASDYNTKLDFFLINKRFEDVEARLKKLEDQATVTFSWSDFFVEMLFIVFIEGAAVGIAASKFKDAIEDVLKEQKLFKLSQSVNGLLPDLGKQMFTKGVDNVIKSLREKKVTFSQDTRFKDKSKVISAAGQAATDLMKLFSCLTVHGFLPRSAYPVISDLLRNRMNYYNEHKNDINEIWLSYEFDTALLCSMLKPGLSIILKKGVNDYVGINLNFLKQKDVLYSAAASLEEKALYGIMNSFVSYNNLLDSYISPHTTSGYNHDLIDISRFITGTDRYGGDNISPMTNHLVKSLVGDLSRIGADFNIRINLLSAEDLLFWAIESIMYPDAPIETSAKYVRYWYIAHVPPLGEAMAVSLYNKMFAGFSIMNITVEPGIYFTDINVGQYTAGREKQVRVREIYKNYMGAGS